MKYLGLLGFSLLLIGQSYGETVGEARTENLNFLLITVDDMNCDSLGVYGCPIDTSPHIDRLAAESLRFQYAHVQVANCFPSRNVMWSGRYPHTSGLEGFYRIESVAFPVLCDVMQEAGYYTAIRGKVKHSTPYQPYHWDDDLTKREDGRKEHLKDVESYHRATARGIAEANAQGKPFCLSINVSDPHKPFWYHDDPYRPTRIFRGDEVPVPGFLFDDPVVRAELGLYYSSVRRADDCVGEILRALEESGEAENTFVMFLSDHGMPLPFAKTQLYHHSTWTPLIIRWPGVTEPGDVDETHMVSAVDFLPTLCDVAAVDHPSGMDGRSFEPLLRGETQTGRDSVFKVYNENSGGHRHPMRAVQTKDYLYLFNPWSDGQNEFKSATQGTSTYQRMKEIARIDAKMEERLDFLDHRCVEEFYDMRTDPDCRINLVHSEPARSELRQHTQMLGELEAHRSLLEHFMEETGDHALEAFKNRDDRLLRLSYVAEVTRESDARMESETKKPKREISERKARRYYANQQAAEFTSVFLESSDESDL